MLRGLIAVVFSTMLSGSAFAATCPLSSVQVKDNLNNTANMSLADDGTGNGTCITGGEQAVINAVKTALPLATTNGWTPVVKTGIVGTVLSVKASAGWLGLAQCDNNNNAWSYLQIFNVAAGSVTLGSTVPIQIVPIPPNVSNGFVANAVGMQYGTAISIAATTTATGSTPVSTGLNCTFGFN